MARKRFHRKHLLLIALALLLLIPLIHSSQVQPALAGASYLLTGNQTIAGTNRMINISVTNLNDTNRSIANITVSLPTGFTYVNTTNQTSLNSLRANFTNTSSNLTWYSFNSTSGILNISETGWFAFNATTWATAGDHNLTVFAIDNGTVPLVNATALAITIIGANTSNSTFSVSRPNIAANWTPGDLIVVSNINNSNLSVLFNTTNTSITPLAFNASIWPQGAYPSLDATNRSLCFGTVVPFGTGFHAANATQFVNNTLPLNLTSVPAQNITITPHAFCPPGQYRGNFTLANNTNQSDNLSLRLTIDVPLNGSNTYRSANLSNITGWLRGNITAGLVNNFDNRNLSGYQRFFFSTNRSHNQTFVTINLSSLSDNADIHLLNGTTSGADPQLIGFSSKLASADDSIDGVWLTANEAYELRVSGNATTSYNALVYFAPLNITNQSSSGENVTELDYGTINASNTTNDTSRNLNFSLMTAVDTNVTGLAQSIELWRVERFLSHNTSQAYWAFVPNFTQKLEILLQWMPNRTAANSTFWGMNLTRLDGLLVNSSDTNSSISGNASNTTVTARIDHFGPFNTTNDGWWNISVANITANGNGSANTYYNLTVRAYLPASSWVQHNFSSPSALYSTGFTLTNSSYAQNNSLLLRTNITTPVGDALNGSYEGSYRWFNGTGWVVKLPFKFSVRAGGLA
ncbi:MAG TPA: hypothetical protein VJB16_01250, partial [archaeon]|nr:hypothetical protein [archaeon]